MLSGTDICSSTRPDPPFSPRNRCQIYHSTFFLIILHKVQIGKPPPLHVFVMPPLSVSNRLKTLSFRIQNRISRPSGNFVIKSNQTPAVIHHPAVSHFFTFSPSIRHFIAKDESCYQFHRLCGLHAGSNPRHHEECHRSTAPACRRKCR